MAALAAVTMLPGPASAGSGSLIEACQMAVKVHAKRVSLEFLHGTREGQEVDLRFAFGSGDGTHLGKARCAFHKAPSPSAPPSLVGLDMTGKMSPRLFLMSHHAVWHYFKGDPQPVAEGIPGPEETDPPARPIRDGALHRASRPGGNPAAG